MVTASVVIHVQFCISHVIPLLPNTVTSVRPGTSVPRTALRKATDAKGLYEGTLLDPSPQVRAGV